jgi:hypothetical protein
MDMSDNLAMIKTIIEAHNTVRGHLKLVGESETDLEALFNLQKAHAEWSLSSLESLAENQKKLQQNLSALTEGLKNHFQLEQRSLPPLLGELVMLALSLEHQEINKLLSQAKSVVTETRLDGLNQEKLLSKKSEIQLLVSNILQKVQEHATKEETILKMVQKALESKQSR